MNRAIYSLIILGLIFSISNVALGQDGAKRKYTLATKNIHHAKENLPLQVYTEDPELTKQVHNLYIDCLFDKVWERYNGADGIGIGVKDYCWGIAAWSIALNTIYGIQEDYKTIVIPSDAKGRHLKLGKLEVKYPTDNSVELITAFEPEFKVVFPEKTGKIKVCCNGEKVKKGNLNIAASEVTFTAMSGKTYMVTSGKKRKTP